MFLRPPNPKPHREFFKSEQAYQAALNSYRRTKEIDDEADRWALAFVIVFVSLMVLGFASFLLGAAYAEFGWRGPAYLTASIGLLWVAVIQVKNRL